ncbi:MAG: 50S ribosome-binding GTPase [Calothrix sp. MO_167.B12]|nr:50S ribosome-binding GTPase [Calothrix sp. MO_167.B12]
MDQEQVKNRFQEFIDKLQGAKSRQFTFLLAGRTGVGKSSTVNSLMGKKVAPTGDFEPTTMKVEVYPSEISGIRFKVVDTPGLCDDLEESGNDYKYLDLMRSQVEEIDSMWFVSKLSETRVTSDEKRGIKLISQTLSSDVWNHAIIVFTFANQVEAEKYQTFLEKRTELIRKEIAKYAGEKIANEIPSVAVDNLSETTPDGEKWLGELYTKVFSRMSKRGATPFLVATAESIVPKKYIPSFNRQGNEQETSLNNEQNQDESKPRIELNKEQRNEIIRTIDASIIPSLAAIGAGVGSIVPGAGTAVGAAVGAGVGAVIGLIAWISSKD